VPVDQIMLRPGDPTPVLMLPPGKLWMRTFDVKAVVAGPVDLTVE
jgi:hypothetical protein